VRIKRRFSDFEGGTLIHTDKHIQLDRVDSTNNFIKNPQIPYGSYVTAAEQTQGRGRGTNRWLDLGSDRLIFSAKVKLVSDSPPFPLLVGGAVLKACHDANGAIRENLTLKWPNDIYRDDKKIGGILIESEKQGDYAVVIGVGINIFGEQPAAEFTEGFLMDVAVPEIRDALIARLVLRLNETIERLGDTAVCLREIAWIYANSLLKGKIVSLQYGGATVTGTVCGYTPEGFLRLVQGQREWKIPDAATQIRIHDAA
jgi:BirA family biotin operon repressor/biotin-[acetyl-CoA-carboxylase] ligase